MPNEKTSLLPKAKFFDSSKMWRWAGFGVTCGAMIPQGLLGMVLWDEQVMQRYCDERAYLPLRIGTDIAIFIGSIVGKLMIVYYYNGHAWENFAYPNWQRLNPHTWTKNGVINAAFTVPISSFFGWLAQAGCLQAAGVLRDYDTHVTDDMANIVASPYFYAPFCAVAFGANLLSFPPIHRGAVNVLRSYADVCVQSIAYKRQIREFRYAVLETVRMRLKYLYEHKNTLYEQTVTERLKENITLSSAITQADFDLDKLFQFAKELAEQGHKVKPESWLEWCLKGILVPLNAGVVTAGVYNFYSLTVGALTSLFCAGNNDNCELDTGGEILANIIAAMVLTSMACMALSIMDNNTKRGLRHLFGRPPLNVLSQRKTIANYIWSALVVMFGAAPNTQQAFMANLSVPLKILAPLSSMGYEGLGTVDVTEAMFIKKTDQQKIAAKVDELLRQWEENISENNVAELKTVQKYNRWYSFFTGRTQTAQPTSALNIQQDVETGAESSSSAKSSWRCTIL